MPSTSAGHHPPLLSLLADVDAVPWAPFAMANATLHSSRTNETVKSCLKCPAAMQCGKCVRRLCAVAPRPGEEGASGTDGKRERGLSRATSRAAWHRGSGARVLKEIENRPAHLLLERGCCRLAGAHQIKSVGGLAIDGPDRNQVTVRARPIWRRVVRLQPDITHELGRRAGRKIPILMDSVRIAVPALRFQPHTFRLDWSSSFHQHWGPPGGRLAVSQPTAWS